MVEAAMRCICMFLLLAGNIFETPGRRLLATVDRRFPGDLLEWRQNRDCIAFVHSAPRLSSVQRRAAHPQLSEDGRPSVSWIKVADVPAVDASENVTVLPVFPLHAVHWLGGEGEHVLNIIDPAYRRMYDDILLSGSRRFVVPWSPCAPGFPPGRIRFKEIQEEDRQLHAVGVVMYLEDLREVSERTKNRIKYQCVHKIVGRARMTRLLNPSALFTTNDEGFKVDYLRAEVELYDDLIDRVDSTLPKSIADELHAVWVDMLQTIGQISDEELGYKTMDANKTQDLRDFIARTNTWELAAFWERFQLKVQYQRESARINTEIEDWIKERQESGDRSYDIDMLKIGFITPKVGLPEPLKEKLLGLQSGAGIQLSGDYWEPLLRLQAAEGPKERGELLVEVARDEVQGLRARAALKAVLD